MRRYESARFSKCMPRLQRKKAPGVPGRRRGFSKISDEALYELVKAEIVRYSNSPHSDYGRFPVRAEWYANEHKVPIHRITQIFMKLNHEGLMSRRSNEKTDLPWNASYYYVRSGKEARH